MSDENLKLVFDGSGVEKGEIDVQDHYTQTRREMTGGRTLYYENGIDRNICCVAGYMKADRFLGIIRQVFGKTISK